MRLSSRCAASLARSGFFLCWRSDGGRSPYVDTVADELRRSRHDVSIQEVPYEFQQGGKEMMRVVTDCAFMVGPIARRGSRTP